MKNLFNLCILCVFIFASCSKDETNYSSSIIETVDLASDTFQNSNAGIYNGVFTTIDGLERGSITVIIPADETRFPFAQLNFSSGDELILEATQTILFNTAINNLLFESDNTSLYFSVAADGKTPEITNIFLNDKEGSMLIRKHTTRAPVAPIPGTYMCDECGTHPVLDNSTTQTFNILMFTTPDGDSAFDTEVALGMTVFNGAGSQANCVANGTETACDISGDFMVSSAPITWTGSHTFNNEATGSQDCSGAAGTWTFESINFGTLTGTFESDESCDASGGGLFISEIADPNNFNGSGQDNARFLELTNGSSMNLDISGYIVELYSNANTSAGADFTIPMNTVLMSGQSYVIATNEEDFNMIYANVVADVQFGSFNSNGNDTYVITDADGTLIDIYGQIGTDQLGTCAEFKNGRALRAAGTTEGSVVFNESEWIIRADSAVNGCTDHANDPQDAPADFNPGAF